MNGAGTLFADGFWRNNAAFVQLLGLCPLLAITTTLVNGLALGIATTMVLIATNCVVSLVRGALVPSIRIVIFVLIIASLVTTVDMLTNAFFHDLYRVLGLFIPLIITNCAILAQAESVASRRRIDQAALSGTGHRTWICRGPGPAGRAAGDRRVRHVVLRHEFTARRSSPRRLPGSTP